MPWEQSSTFRGNMYPGFALSFRKEKTMSDLIGWLWAILVVLGVGGLGFTIDAYDSAKILSRRRKNRRQAQGATRELYREEELSWRRPEAFP